LACWPIAVSGSFHTGEPKPGTGGTVIRFVNDEPIGAGSPSAAHAP